MRRWRMAGGCVAARACHARVRARAMGGLVGGRAIDGLMGAASASLNNGHVAACTPRFQRLGVMIRHDMHASVSLDRSAQRLERGTDARSRALPILLSVLLSRRH